MSFCLVGKIGFEVLVYCYELLLNLYVFRIGCYVLFGDVVVDVY